MKSLYLYRTEVDAMSIYYVEDITANKIICVDWDLDDKQERELIEQFSDNRLDYTANGGEWEEPTEAYIYSPYPKVLLFAKLFNKE